MYRMDDSDSGRSINLFRLQQESGAGHTANTATAAGVPDGNSSRESRGHSTGAVYDANVANKQRE
jgi:hypothetical protein